MPSAKSKQGVRKQSHIKALYYITHIDNIPSILEHGILSHEAVERRHIPFTPIYDGAIVSHRHERFAPDGNNLWHFANLYFQPRNPMLYRVMNEKTAKKIVIFAVNPSVIDLPGAYITTGNAASRPTDILSPTEGREAITQMWNVIQSEWWREEDGSKRKMMAECLIPDRIPPTYLLTIFTNSHFAAENVKSLIGDSAISVVPEPQMFFHPRQTIRLTRTLSLIDGDMFFSQHQTLTISVNTVGVMGKGLASRAKYQFPDVYVYYQDVCRQGELRMGRPCIYKRETSLDSELAADPFSLPHPNANKWFLLFPTKRHWKEGSDIVGIEQGLVWLQEQYQQQEIHSLAIPALGCGLGGLEWRQVGPLMCKYLANLTIPVGIYLPREQTIPPNFMTPDFLLGTSAKHETS